MFERINKRLESFLVCFCRSTIPGSGGIWKNVFDCRRYSSPDDLLLALPSWSHHIVRFPPKLFDFFHRSSWLLASHAARASSSWRDSGFSAFSQNQLQGWQLPEFLALSAGVVRLQTPRVHLSSYFAVWSESIHAKNRNLFFVIILDSWCVRCSCIASPLFDLFYSVVFFYVFLFFVLLSQQFSILPQYDLLSRLTNQWQQCLQLRGVCSPWCIHFCICGSRNQDQGGRGRQSSSISSYNDSIAVALFVISGPEARSSLCISDRLITCILSPIPSLIFCLCNALLMLCTVCSPSMRLRVCELSLTCELRRKATTSPASSNTFYSTEFWS